MKKNLIEDYIGQTQEERDKIAFELQKSPFDEWVQLNKQGLQHLMLLNTISPLATNILYFLIENSNNYNCVIVSQSTLGKIFKATSARRKALARSSGSP